MGARKQRAIACRMRPLSYVLSALIVCLLLVLPRAFTVAQTPEASREAPQAAPASPIGSEGRTLTVGLLSAPPFVIKSSNNQGDTDWDGIGVQLWREMAYELNLDYQWREVQPEQAVAQLESGTLDVALMTATVAREQRVNFTQSYFATTLGIATKRRQRLWEVVKAVVSPQFLKICLGLSMILFVVGLLCWLFERSSNENMYSKSPIKGIWDGFWWAGVTMTTIGYGDKAPQTVLGRILALIWMLVAMGLTASLTSSITSVLLLNEGIQPLPIEDLTSMQVGSIENSTAAQYLKQEQIQFQTFSAPKAGLEAVASGEIDAFVDGATTLQTLNQDDFQKRLQIESTGIQASQYAFALPNNSPLRESLNQQILQELSESDWSSLLQRYLPSQGQ